MFLKRILAPFLVLAFLLLVVVFTSVSNAQTSAVPECREKNLNPQQCIDYLSGKISDLKSQVSTLSNQIAIMDNQIKLTEYRIAATEADITDLTLDIDTASKKIVGLEKSLDQLVVVLMNRVKATYAVGTIQPLHVLLTSNDAGDFVSRLNYLKLVQAHDKKLIYETQQAKVDYTNQKEVLEGKKKKIEQLKAQLVEYDNQLEQEKRAKNALLNETRGSEANYQRLLAQARAEFLAIQGIIAGKGTEEQVREVKKGDVIASIIPTASCNSSGAHLHFTVLEGGTAVNPFSKLKDVPHNDNTGGDPWNPSGSWDWPISPTIQFNQGYGVTSCVTSGFCGKIYSSHNGLDISSSSYTVYAVADGTMYRGSYSVGCALPYVRVKHKDSNIDTLYLHTYSN